MPSKSPSRGDRGGVRNGARIIRGKPDTKQSEYNRRREDVLSGQIAADFLCPVCLKYIDVREDGSPRAHTASGVACPGATPRIPGVDLADLCEHGEFPKDRGTLCSCPRPPRKRRATS